MLCGNDIILSFIVFHHAFCDPLKPLEGLVVASFLTKVLDDFFACFSPKP